VSFDHGRADTHPPPTSAPEVAVLRWPEEDRTRALLAERGLPRLLLLSRDCPAPINIDTLEDWLREPIDHRELEARADVLRRRASTTSPEVRLDEHDGIVRHGTRWVHLSPAQLRVARLLFERAGSVVTRDEVRAACAEGDTSPDPRAVKSLVLRLAQRLRSIGVEVHNVRGRGWMLQAGVPTAAPGSQTDNTFLTASLRSPFAIGSLLGNVPETRPDATSSQHVLLSDVRAT